MERNLNFQIRNFKCMICGRVRPKREQLRESSKKLTGGIGCEREILPGMWWETDRKRAGK